MEKKYRTQVKRDKKKVGQLAYENHWSVVGLIKSLHYKQEEINTWAKLNKQS